MMKLHSGFILGIMLIAGIAKAQTPVTINRSTIDSGGTVILPTFTVNGAVAEGGSVGGSVNMVIYPVQPSFYSVSGSTVLMSNIFASSTATITPSTGVAVNDAPGLNHLYGCNFTVTPAVVVFTNAPSVFTNIVSILGAWHEAPGQPGLGVSVTVSNSYVITVIENSGGGSTPDTAALSGQGSILQNLSRKDTSTSPRELIGFQLSATTNAVLTSLAITISNTSTNTPVSGQLVDTIRLLQDADGGQIFDAGDVVLATSSNINGIAAFSGLSVNLNTTNTTFFVSAVFDPSQQQKNSFVTAQLKSSNIVVTRAGTNMVLTVNGGTITGKQYAFLDTTTAEDAAAAAALAVQINSAISSATSSLKSSSTSNSTDLIDSILPAAAAGAAGVGAAFTSDSIKQTPLSQEYLPIR